MSERKTPDRLDDLLTTFLKSRAETYAIRLLAGEARDELRKLKRERDAAVEALEHVKNVLGTGECKVNTCEGCKYELMEAISTVRDVLAEIEGKS